MGRKKLENPLRRIYTIRFTDEMYAYALSKQMKNSIRAFLSKQMSESSTAKSNDVK